VSVSANDQEITVHNAPGFSFPSPRGINVTNEVRISLKFKKPLLLKDALAAVYDLRLFAKRLARRSNASPELHFGIRIQANAKDSYRSILLMKKRNRDGRRTLGTISFLAALIAKSSRRF
jgi:hypothetical protein